MDFFTSEFQELLKDTWVFIPKLIAALLTFSVTLVASSAVARSVKRTLQRRKVDPETQNLLSRMARWTVLVLGTVLALEQVEFNVTSFMAGLGVLGFTVGFALQDISRNFIAGILLLLRQPFEIGDAVTVGGSYSGKILEINTRDTVLMTWDGEHVILPNIDVFNNPIINYSQVQSRRRTIYIGLGYDEDPDAAIDAFLDALRSVEGVQEKPPPTIRAEELGNSTLQLAARFWVDQKTYDLFDVHSRVVLAIQKTAEERGINLPYPIQTVRVESV
ncbi:MAG: mechanosensitive ion channel family protein [Anaerolineae bacterium]